MCSYAAALRLSIGCSYAAALLAFYWVQLRCCTATFYWVQLRCCTAACDCVQLCCCTAVGSPGAVTLLHCCLRLSAVTLPHCNTSPRLQFEHLQVSLSLHVYTPSTVRLTLCPHTVLSRTPYLECSGTLLHGCFLDCSFNTCRYHVHITYIHRRQHV